MSSVKSARVEIQTGLVPPSAWTVLLAPGELPEVVEVTEPDFLTAAQALVGGYVEPVAPLGLTITQTRLLVDEEGLLKDLPINALASYLYGFHWHGQPIHGPAVACRQTLTNDGEPDLAWLDCRHATRLREQLLQLGELPFAGVRS